MVVDSSDYPWLAFDSIESEKGIQNRFEGRTMPVRIVVFLVGRRSWLCDDDAHGVWSKIRRRTHTETFTMLRAAASTLAKRTISRSSAGYVDMISVVMPETFRMFVRWVSSMVDDDRRSEGGRVDSLRTPSVVYSENAQQHGKAKRQQWKTSTLRIIVLT